MRALGLAAVLAATVFQSAAAQDVDPQWIRVPSAEETQAVWPADALQRGINGQVVLECVVTLQGAADACAVKSEEPTGHGFGAAALQLAPIFSLKPGTKGGQPVRSSVTIPVSFAAPLQVSPDWLKKPDSADFYAAFPLRAVAEGQDGQAIIRCDVTTTGALEHCVVEDERPAGYDFGGAALLLAPSFLMKPAQRDGKRARSQVRIPIIFKAGGMQTRSGSRTHVGVNSTEATPMIARPIWETAPGFADLKSAWPPQAPAGPAHVSMRCEVQADGSLEDCAVLTEYPLWKGFGGAAKKLAPKFRMRTAPGQAIAKARVNIAVDFIDPQSARPPSISKPQWITQLDPAKVAAVYPDKAAAAKISTGVGVADCLVASNGALTDCKPASAKPDGFGFAEAAVAIASVMRMNPWTEAGGPVDGVRLKLPVTFNLAPEDAPKP